MINILLNHLVAPSISPEVMNETVNEGSNASFTCQAIGEPLPTISWYFNDTALEQANTTKYIITNNRLNIVNVESSDAGTYICIATNVISNDTSSGVLTVNGESLILVLYLQIIVLIVVGPNITAPVEVQQFIVTERMNGSITCTATGYPVPTVVWQNSDGSSLSNNRLVSGSPVNISSTGVGNVTRVSVEMMVIGAVRVDTGIYRCSANNSVNNATRNINITIHCK